MKRVCCVLASTLLFAACGSNAPAPEPAQTDASAVQMRPYGTLAQMMQAIPFHASNIIFDAQSSDPGAKQEGVPGGADTGATANYATTYGGWTAVENAAIAISETANLLMIPGRMCRNGKPAPNDRADYQKFTAQLADAGQAALKAAQAKDLDAIVDVSGVVTEACAACHDVYRSENEEERCTPSGGQ